MTATAPVFGKPIEPRDTAGRMMGGRQTSMLYLNSGRDRVAADRSQPAEKPSPPRCGACGGVISQDDLVCPHCGESLVGG